MINIDNGSSFGNISFLFKESQMSNEEIAESIQERAVVTNTDFATMEEAQRVQDLIFRFREIIDEMAVTENELGLAIKYLNNPDLIS